LTPTSVSGAAVGTTVSRRVTVTAPAAKPKKHKKK